MATACLPKSWSTPMTTSIWARARTIPFQPRFTWQPPLKSRRDCFRPLRRMHESLARKAEEWDKVIKIGRTHLMDATPLRLGQEFGGFARQLELSIQRAESARDAVLELPVGGTAVGSGINTHPEFGGRVAAVLAEKTGLKFVEANNHFEANAQRDGLVQSHGELKCIAQTLFNVANNIRWLGSGPPLRILRGQTSQPPTGQQHHAGEGQPRDVRVNDAADRTGDRKTTRRSPWPAPRVVIFSSTS